MSLARPIPARLLAALAALAACAALTVDSEARAAKVSLEGGATTLALDPGAVEALTSLGVKAEPIAPAKAGSGSFRFPITGGRVDADSLAGQIRHGGGIALVKGSTRVALTRFAIRVDKTPDLTAKVGGKRVSILSLDLSGSKRSDKGSTVRLRGIEASLTAAAAGALNQAFATTAFKEGLTLGSARVRAVVG